MAVTAVFEVPGMTSQQYDTVIKNLEARGAGAPDGRLYHVASPTPDGWLVVDVWESEEKLGKFAETLMPVLASAGVQPPAPKVYKAHNIIEG